MIEKSYKEIIVRIIDDIKNTQKAIFAGANTIKYANLTQFGRRRLPNCPGAIIYLFLTKFKIKMKYLPKELSVNLPTEEDINLHIDIKE